ncbi:hypothetical protein [Methanoregula sp.]|uniref:hypothetical protein n=1 Tax=Methanoregula sp. TaxID=2052170 RepID=UPI000CAAF675|nr:hypothetical protein [Methanoregula sp.]PKG33693.1 MAG: hypothetical protein CW742_01675 [Methanoregula sp.]
MRSRENDRKAGSAEQPGGPWDWMQTATGRLILLPLILSGAWILEIFLFQGWPHVFLHPEPFGLLFYTLMTCIFIGILVPVALMRQAFLRGDANMHQLGFRSTRRTLLMAGLTLLIVWMAVVLQNPFATDRPGFVFVYLLLLPTGIATAMVCCVLAGTHVQAFVRERGALVAILAGTAVSALLFGLSLTAHFPDAVTPVSFLRFLSAGALSALFFFAVRDVWAVSIVVTASLVWLTAGWLDPAQVSLHYPAVLAAALLSAGILAALQWYLSRHYITIPAPPG